MNSGWLESDVNRKDEMLSIHLLLAEMNKLDANKIIDFESGASVPYFAHFI